MTNRGKGWILVLSLALVGTAVGLTIPLVQAKKNESAAHGRLNALYEKSYYDVTDELRNVETKLSKVNAVSGEAVKRELLADVWKECDAAVSGIAQLSGGGEDTEAVIGFLNKVGDYAYYLMGKIGAGKAISEEEKENVRLFRDLVARLRADLASVGETMTEGDRISADVLSDLTAVDGAIKSYSSVDYPELIYDGPFSDGLNDREAKFLAGKEEIDEQKATDVVRRIWEDAESVNVAGESTSSIPSYVVEFTRGGLQYVAFVTKAGGYIAMLNAYGETDDPTVTEEESKAKARDFLTAIGYENMTCVWVYDNDSTVYLNFAYTENDVVFYPDLVKVKVSLNDGSILGVEGTNYLYNHTQREIDYDFGAEPDVEPRVSVTETRYCVVPTEWNTEVLCKEYKGTYDGMTYYLYYDTETGEEIRALVVVDESGEKLM